MFIMISLYWKINLITKTVHSLWAGHACVFQPYVTELYRDEQSYTEIYRDEQNYIELNTCSIIVVILGVSVYWSLWQQKSTKSCVVIINVNIDNKVRHC